MKRKAASILVTGLIVASLIGCGAKTANYEETPVTVLDGILNKAATAQSLQIKISI